MSSRATVFVTVEPKNSNFFIRKWTGRTILLVRKAAKEKYQREFPGCRISFGNGFYTHNYGAH